MSSIIVDFENCDTVLGFLDRMVKALKVMPFYGANLEVMGKTISSLEKHGFAFPLTLKLDNVQGYKTKCPNGWKIFLTSLEKAKEEYAKKGMIFNYSCTD
ncbi:MAG: barstar family protein [Nanoarchaeota archaeon]